METTVLFDTSYLYALFCTNDVNHTLVANLAQQDEAEVIIPDVILPEVKFLFRMAGSLFTAMAFMDALSETAAPIAPLTEQDVDRANALAKQYRSQGVSFTQCAIVAIAERLSIDTIYSLQPAPFRIVQPLHCEQLAVYPTTA